MEHTAATRSSGLPVIIPAAGVVIAGDLGGVVGSSVISPPLGIVIFAHGSGSSRMSPRNQHVANLLRQHGLATLLLDLLTTEEQYVISKRFDIALLTTRLAEAVRWVRDQENLTDLPIALFGASTGAAAAPLGATAAGGGLRLRQTTNIAAPKAAMARLNHWPGPMPPRVDS